MNKHIDIQFFALGGQTTVNFPNQIQDYYDRVALAKALPLMTFRKWAQNRPIPQNSGEIIRFKRWGDLLPALDELQEGVTPPSSVMTYEEVTARLKEYGAWIGVTNRVLLTGIDPFLTQASEQLGQQEANTFDTLMRNVLLSGSNPIYANGAGARDEVVAKPADADFNKAIRALKMANAKYMTEQVDATVKYNTSPIRAGYIAVFNSYLSNDIEAISGFVPVEKYASYGGVIEGEIGSYKGIRFVETTQGMCYEGGGGNSRAVKNTGGKADVYPILILAKDSYGEVPLSNNNHKIIIKVNQEGNRTDSSDPLNQRGSAGKHSYALVA